MTMQNAMTSASRIAFAVFTAAAAVLGAAQPADATAFQISALGLDTLTGTRGVEFHGMLTQASGDFFAAGSCSTREALFAASARPASA